MLPKHRRLNLKSDFTWVAKGNNSENSFFKIFFRRSTNCFPKLGIALSKDRFKKAHERTLARRKTSAAFEALYDQLDKDLNIIALPKAQLVEKELGELVISLRELLREENLLKDENSGNTNN